MLYAKKKKTKKVSLIACLSNYSVFWDLRSRVEIKWAEKLSFSFPLTVCHYFRYVKVIICEGIFEEVFIFLNYGWKIACDAS